MLQRGRKSAASFELPHLAGAELRLSTPPDLTAEEAELFDELVAATSAKHFRVSDVPLLISFVQATLAARAVARDPAQTKAWEGAVRVQAMLANRLRLSPQSRSDPKTVARENYDSGLRKPWDPIEAIKPEETEP